MQWANDAVKAPAYSDASHRGECHRIEDLGVRLIQTGKDRFTVVYGKQVKQGLSYGEAAASMAPASCTRSPATACSTIASAASANCPSFPRNSGIRAMTDIQTDVLHRKPFTVPTTHGGMRLSLNSAAKAGEVRYTPAGAGETRLSPSPDLQRSVPCL